MKLDLTRLGPSFQLQRGTLIVAAGEDPLSIHIGLLGAQQRFQQDGAEGDVYFLARSVAEGEEMRAQYLKEQKYSLDLLLGLLESLQARLAKNSASRSTKEESDDQRNAHWYDDWRYGRLHPDDEIEELALACAFRLAHKRSRYLPIQAPSDDMYSFGMPLVESFIAGQRECYCGKPNCRIGWVFSFLVYLEAEWAK